MKKSENKYLIRNLQLLSELKTILLEAHNQKLKVIILKGLSYLNEIYNDISERPVGDIDLLVSKKNVDAVSKILLKNGYNFLATNRGNHDCYWKENAPKIMIEIHWDLYKRSNPWQSFMAGINIEECLANARECDYEGVLGYSLSYEDEFIYACVHGIKEVFGEDKWIKDIALMLECFSNKIEWVSFWNKICERKLDRAICFALKVVRTKGYVVPDYANRFIESKKEYKSLDFFCEIIKSGDDLWNWRPILFPALKETWLERLKILPQAIFYFIKFRIFGK